MPSGPEASVSGASDALVGEVLDGRYRIEEVLGEGGMGVVYGARHEVLGSRVAIKVLRADISGDAEAIARLRREARAASSIGNEHIVDVRDFGQLPDGSTFIVMERIDGRDLFTIVCERPIEWERAVGIALQVCEALGAAHESGIVHRNLKLENVLLTSARGRSDFVKVFDFGIAKMQDGAKITVAGRVMGTPEYMSPEQCAGRGVDHRTDIYSFGVMLYEMVTGTLPFFHQDLVALVRMQMLEAPVPPSQRTPESGDPGRVGAGDPPVPGQGSGRALSEHGRGGRCTPWRRLPVGERGLPCGLVGGGAEPGGRGGRRSSPRPRGVAGSGCRAGSCSSGWSWGWRGSGPDGPFATESLGWRARWRARRRRVRPRPRPCASPRRRRRPRR